MKKPIQSNEVKHQEKPVTEKKHPKKFFLNLLPLPKNRIAGQDNYDVHILDSKTLDIISTFPHSKTIDDGRQDEIVGMVRLKNTLLSIGTITIKYWNLETNKLERTFPYPKGFKWRPIKEMPFLLLPSGKIASIYSLMAKKDNSERSIQVFNPVDNSFQQLGETISEFASNTKLALKDNQLVVGVSVLDGSILTATRLHQLRSLGIDGQTNRPVQTDVLMYDLSIFVLNADSFVRFYSPVGGGKEEVNFAEIYTWNSVDNRYEVVKKISLVPLEHVEHRLVENKTLFLSVEINIESPKLDSSNRICFVLDIHLRLHNHTVVKQSEFGVLDLTDLSVNYSRLPVVTVHSFTEVSKGNFLLSSGDGELSHHEDPFLKSKAIKDIILGTTLLPDRGVVDIVLDYFQDDIPDFTKINTAQKMVLTEVIEAYKEYVRNHRSSSNEDRTNGIDKLEKQLKLTTSVAAIEQALIDVVKDLRTANQKGGYKYGTTLFGAHVESYQESQLYKLIKPALAKINPGRNLDLESDPNSESKADFGFQKK